MYHRPMPLTRLLLALGLAGLMAVAQAAQQDMRTLQDAVADWLEQQLSPTPDASYQLAELDSRLRLDACQRFDLQLPKGQRLAGKIMVRVRCVEGARWAINYPATISLVSTYYVASRPLSAGREVQTDDLIAQKGDLATLPGSVIVSANQAIGRVLNSAVAQGGVLRSEMLRAATAVRQNQRIRLLYRVDGMEVSNEGVALNTAAVGEVVRVRVGNNQIVTGIAREGGLVEAGP